MSNCELCGKLETPDGMFNGHAECYDEHMYRDRNGICNRCNVDLPGCLPYTECNNCDDNTKYVGYDKIYQ